MLAARSVPRCVGWKGGSLNKRMTASVERAFSSRAIGGFGIAIEIRCTRHHRRQIRPCAPYKMILTDTSYKTRVVVFTLYLAT